MTTSHPRRLRAALARRALLAGLLAPIASLYAQQAPVPAPTTRPPAASSSSSSGSAAEDKITQLNPFEVKADSDNGYGALQSNSLTAFGVDLDKMPATTEVFTRTFIDDVAATNVQDVLLNYSGVVTADPNNAGAALTMPGDRDGSGGSLGVRGLASSAPKRDGFVGFHASNRSSFGLNDTFATERIEIIEGPQSILYGAAGGGGVVNIVSKQAHFNRSNGYVRTRLDQYGSKRAEVDYNYGVDKLAFRFSAVGNTDRGYRYNLGDDLYGAFEEVAYRPFAQTVIRVYRESTNAFNIDADNPSQSAINNFLPAGDPRRTGQSDVRYLALTGQLTDLRGKIWNGPVDYQHISSFGAWWQSEQIRNAYNGVTIESVLGAGFSMQLAGIYSETIDDRWTTGPALTPAKGLTGSGANPYDGTAMSFTPTENWQSDRTRGVKAIFLHDGHFVRDIVHSQTALGFEATHQGPAFGSSGIQRQYFQADSNWNPVISPTVKTNYGRVPLGTLYFPIQGGIPLRPIFQPGTRKVTLNGQNYVLEPNIYASTGQGYNTPTNPFGLIPNNGTGYTGSWNKGAETHDKQLFLANYTSWWHDAFNTMAGINIDRFGSENVGAGSVPTILLPQNYVGWDFGVNARVYHGLRAYATVSTAGLSAGTTKDFYGNALKVPKAESPAPEIGLKYDSPEHTFQAQLSYDFTTKVQNETRNAGTDLYRAVNPAGINGTYNNADQWINLDRKASSLELSVAYNPTPYWRMQAGFSHPDGEITSDVNFKQLYNDQFYTSGTTVTYKDGTPVLVDPAGKGGAKTTALTLAMINDPTNPYYAAPDQTTLGNGQITSALLKTTLTTVDPVHGSANTGVTGLPISAIQYNFVNPHPGGVITVVHAGDKNTGENEFNFHFVNRNQISQGFLRGLGIFESLTTYWKNRAYYTSYFPTAATGNALQVTSRPLVRMPTSTLITLGLSYHYRLPGRLSRFDLSSQLNIGNLFNHDRVFILPNSANGANLQARLSAQPRTFVWSNSVKF